MENYIPYQKVDSHCLCGWKLDPLSYDTNNVQKTKDYVVLQYTCPLCGTTTKTNTENNVYGWFTRINKILNKGKHQTTVA